MNTRQKIKRILLPVVIIVVAVISAVYFVQRTPDVPKLEKVRVAQAFQHLLYIGLYVANDAGLFRDEGLDVSISTAGGDAQAFAALSSGQVEFAQGDPAFIAIGAEKGWSGRVIGMAVDRVAIWGITFRSDIKPFSDPVGFKGRTVSTYPNPNTSYVVQRQLIQRAGLKLGEDTEIVQVQFGTEIAAAKAGRVDIAQTIEPNASQVEEQGGAIVFSYPDAWGPLAFTGVMVSEETIIKRPAMIQKFMRAYQKALDLIANDREKAVKIAKMELPNLEVPLIERALDRLISSGSIPRSAAVNPESWNRLLQIRVDVGDLREMPKAILYDNQFTRAGEAK